MAPRRPVLWPHQSGLALLTGLILVGSVVLVLLVVTGHGP